MPLVQRNPSQSALTLLGTGTCQLQLHRMASSALIRLEEGSILFDCGRGTCHRLTQLGLRNDDISIVVLSHFHPDHVSDLIPLLQAACWSREDPRTRDLTIIGPRGTENQVMRILSLFDVDNLTCSRFRVHIKEVRQDHFVALNQRFDFIDLPPAGNHGIRFRLDGKTYALTGDSSYHEQEVKFLTSVDIAVIDAGHPTKEELIELAVRTQVPLLVCSHIYVELDEQELQQMAVSKGFKGRIMVASDLMEFPFSS